MSSPQPQDQMQRRFFLDVIIGQGTAVFELLAGKNQALLIRGDAFLILNLGFDVIDRVGWLDIERDRFPGQSFDENLVYKEVIHILSESSENTKVRPNICIRILTCELWTQLQGCLRKLDRKSFLEEDDEDANDDTQHRKLVIKRALTCMMERIDCETEIRKLTI
jgi:hypothetical protein